MCKYEISGSSPTGGKLLCLIKIDSFTNSSTAVEKAGVIAQCTVGTSFVNTLRRWMDADFADDIFTCILINENCCILITFSLKYVRKDLIDNNPSLVQIMAWRRSGDKPLSEPMMVNLSTHICVTRPQWVTKISLFDYLSIVSNSNCWDRSAQDQILPERIYIWID